VSLVIGPTVALDPGNSSATEPGLEFEFVGDVPVFAGAAGSDGLETVDDVLGVSVGEPLAVVLPAPEEVSPDPDCPLPFAVAPDEVDVPPVVLAASALFEVALPSLLPEVPAFAADPEVASTFVGGVADPLGLSAAGALVVVEALSVVEAAPVVEVAPVVAELAFVVDDWVLAVVELELLDLVEFDWVARGTTSPVAGFTVALNWKLNSRPALTATVEPSAF
jgi:hypothetical protein